MQTAASIAITARLNPVGVVGFVPTVYANHPNPTGVVSVKRPTAMWHKNPMIHATMGPKKPSSLN